MAKTILAMFQAGLIVVLLAVPVFPAQSSSPAKKNPSAGPETGMAIYYSDKFVGKPVASGEKYDSKALTAAHRTLPFGTMVKVTNLTNNRSTVVKVNDRGPHGSKTLIIDLSKRAAEEIDIIKDGKVKVKIEVVEAAKR
jgi:rare lipoprotein A